ncbi:MAG: cation:proton antiporter [Acidobacteria bacterium]|nr:cation:proton antiporter [Acidobacteriota bacterium]
MTVTIAFAVLGAVILIGFFANLLFRATKIPSVLLLIGIGIVLGPITGWITSASLIDIAPFFGTLALLIILFEGGLELDIESVITQAPKAAFLAILVFVFSVASVALFAFFALKMSLFHSLLTAAIFGAGSPAICLPVISGLSIRKEIKTFLKLESTLGDVLLIVTVLIMLDFHATGSHSSMEMISRFFASFAVALIVATIAGVMWSRLIGWIGKEPLAYMLTLGFVFLLHFSVEELGGSAAMAVLIFGILLENTHVVAGRISERARYLFGLDIRAEQFVLHEFMKNITAELSFLIRTFFFVYLGLILSFRDITFWIAVSSIAIVLLLLGSRWLAVHSMKRRSRFTIGEMQIVLSMIPRGLATAVMAFIPAQYNVSGTELLPVYAFTVIVLTNVLMTAGVVAAERRLARETSAESRAAEIEPPLPVVQEPEMKLPAEEFDASDLIPERKRPLPAAAESRTPAAPLSFTGYMSRLFEILPEEREWRYIEAIKASSLAQPRFWAQIFFAAVLTALGLVINQSAIIIGAALIVPIAWPVIAAGMALAVGDIYLFLKLLFKLALVAALTAFLAASFSGLLPFSAITAEIASRTKPTILDFMVAFFAGMAGAVMLFSRRRMLQFLPGAVLAVTLLPPLAVMGYGLANGINAEIFRGSAVLFAANFFAAILGASLIYAVAGMPAVAGLKGIHDWKQRELAQPVVELIFKGLRLKNLAGRTGSVRSRLVVAAVFLLALVIPLQMAFNQLSLEFRARQAITEVQKMFESPGRSAIINSASSIGENEIAVRIQVATNSFFSSSDIRHFEERISDRTGKPTHLDLVQSLSDIGEGEKIRGMLRPELPAPVKYITTIPEMAVDLREEIEKNLNTIPLPQSIALLRAGAELDLGRQSSYYRIEYLAEVPLNEDAGELLANILEHQMKLTKGSLSLVHVPARYSLDPDRKGVLSAEDEAQLQSVQSLLARFPQLGADVKLPGTADEKYADKLRTALFDLAPALRNSSRSEISSNQGQDGVITIVLRPMSAAPDEMGISRRP